MKRVLLSTLLLLGVAAQAQTAAPTTPTTPGTAANPTANTEKTVQSMTITSNRGYSLTVPAGWSKPISGVPGADVAFISQAVNGLRPTITVIVQDIPADLKATLADFRDLYAKNITKDVPNYKLLGEKTVKVSGNPAILWTYTGDGDGGTVRWTQIFTLKNNRLYTATLMTPTGTPATTLESGRKALDSLQLK